MGQRSGVAVGCGLGHRTRLGSCATVVVAQPAAVAPIRPLARELPYARSVALKTKKKKVTKEKTGCQQSYQGADQCQGMISSHAKALRRQPTKLEKRFVNRMSGEGVGPECIRNS